MNPQVAGSSPVGHPNYFYERAFKKLSRAQKGFFMFCPEHFRVIGHLNSHFGDHYYEGITRPTLDALVRSGVVESKMGKHQTVLWRRAKPYWPAPPVHKVVLPMERTKQNRSQLVLEAEVKAWLNQHCPYGWHFDQNAVHFPCSTQAVHFVLRWC